MYDTTHSSIFNVLSVSMGEALPHSGDNSIVPQKIDVNTPPDHSLHSHRYYKLLYIIRSDPFESYIDDKKVVLRQNQVYLLPPFTLHTPTNHYDGAMTGINVKFYIKNDALRNRIGFEPTFSDCNEKMCNLLFEMVDLAKKSVPDNDDINILRNLLGSFFKLYFFSAPAQISSLSDEDEPPNEFLPLIKYIYTNYNEDISLSDMADLMHMEKTYFAKKFKLKYNITPVNYLYALRLTLSLDELMYTNISTQALAKNIGFKDVSAYCNAFKKAYGISPTEYRKRSQLRKFVVE